LLGRRLLSQREQSRQRLAQVPERVDAQVFAGPDDGVQHRRRLAPGFTADDAPIVASQRDGTQGPLAQVIIY